MINCDHCQELISLLYDGMIEKARIKDIDEHIKRCEKCQSFKDFLERISSPPSIPDQNLHIWETIKPRLPVLTIPRLIKKMPALFKAAVFLFVLGIACFFYSKSEFIEDQIKLLHNQNITLRRKVTYLEENLLSDISITKQAFYYYDQRQWNRARSCFEQLMLSSKNEETQALALYYMATLAIREKDTLSSIQLLTRFVNNHKNSPYIPSVCMLLEKLEEISVNSEGDNIKGRIEHLLDKIKSYSDYNSYNVMVSY